MNLRSYQTDLDLRAAEHPARRIVVQLPTGGGKSVLIQSEAERTERRVIMAHAEWLVDQLAERIDGQVIKAGVQWDGSRSVIGMVQTLVNRDIPEPDVVLVDEFHHAVAGQYRTILARWPNARVIGYTATPQRLDGQGLDQVADTLLCGPSYRELIDDGWLKPFEHYSIPSDLDLSGCRVIAGDYRKGDVNQAIRRSTVFGDVIEHWRRLGRDGGHASFWPSIEAAEEAASRVPGWHAIHSRMPREQVRSLIDGLRTGSVESLCSVSMIGEGLDIPGLASVSLCRPTKSLTVYLQQAGRCNRGGDGVARVIDHVGNWRGLGLPDDDREWTLQGPIKRKAAPGTVSVWDCPECWVVNRSQQQTCGGCGAAKPRELVLMEERAAELERITSADTGDVHAHCETPEDYLRFAKLHGKRQTWAVLKWCERPSESASPFAIAAGTVRPTIREYVRAARMMGLNESHARIAAEHMRLTRG